MADKVTAQELFTLVEDAEKKVGRGDGVPKCLQMSESTEWYTPASYVDAAREVMGGIDVDPASNEMANKVVRAKVYYTKETNGFDKEWRGRAWVNPPYGYDGPKCNQARWSARLLEQYQAGIVTEAVLLVNAVTDRKWFQPLWDYPICFTDHRIHFYTNKEVKSGTPMGSAIIYFGSQHYKFARVFRKFGRVVCDMNMSFAPATLWDVSA